MISYVIPGPRKVMDDRLCLSKAKGGGMLRRVLGYDSAHGIHRRHFKGETVAVNFKRFERIEARFPQEWSRLVKR